MVVDLFCGAGGMSLGLEQAGFDVALGVDIDGYHCATHERNFPYGKTICGSVVDLNAAKIRRAIGYDGDVDLVCGGPPCQGFSHMGLRDKRDPRNLLVSHFVRLVLEIRPKSFVMENVPGILSGEVREILDAVIVEFERNGYCITKPIGLLDACDFGVPQSRRRMFLIGIREDVGPPISYPCEQSFGQPTRPNVLQAIGDLPEIERYDRLLREDRVPYDRSPRTIYSRVARNRAVDPSDLSRQRIWEERLCTGCLRTVHKPKTVELYAATAPGAMVPGHKLPRLAPDGIAPTLRAGSDSAHGSYTAPRPIHPIVPRCITTREAARLHGFPDWFWFYPSKWHGYRQIGNAVCPPVARAIGHSIRNALGVRLAKRPPKKVELTDAFVLPQKRPRTLRRISQLQEFPPVVSHLFRKAFDARMKTVRKKNFSFSDVAAAIRATGANLHWIRPDTFLAEIKRSRRVNEILEEVLAAGFTIMPVNNNGVIGRFVPIGTPGTIERRETLQIRIADLKEFTRLPEAANLLSETCTSMIKLLSQSKFLYRVWGVRKAQVTLEVQSNGEGKPTISTASIALRGRGTETYAVATFHLKVLPSISRLNAIGRASETDGVLALVPVTSRHMVAIRFSDCRNAPCEVVRAAFEFSDAK